MKSEYIEKNKKMYGRRIEQLDHILKDSSFLTDGSYREFIVSMYKALVTGRKITPKMESAITKVVKTYAKTLNPEYKKKKLDYTENTIAKLNMIKRKLYECKYTPSYERNSEYFLESIEKQVYSRGSLSMKQRKALNKMYTQFTNRIEKGTLSKKEPWHTKEKG
jgi:arginine decarboxylase-like protein